MVNGTTHNYNFDFSGGRLCLDFANTLSDRKEERPVERLTGYDALVAWALQAGALTSEEADSLLGAAVAQPVEAEEVLHRARTLREAIYRIFSAVAAGTRSTAQDLDTLNRELSATMCNVRLVPSERGFRWGWTQDGLSQGDMSLDRVLWPVVRSAADLLTSEDELARVKECAADDCGWLFMDLSKNRSRHWCDMTSCGNRAKARRHYRRIRGSEVTGDALR
jgi:predicted RNA-binding Zn ribbon-like protein